MRELRKRLIVFVLVGVASAPAAAAGSLHEVDVRGDGIAPSHITVGVGDTVLWHFDDSFDSIESGLVGRFDGNFRFEGRAESFEVTFDRAYIRSAPMPDRTYPYYVRSADGALFTGSVTVSGGTVHEVELFRMDFVPADIEIEVGDTVRWIWQVDFHNVESGVGGTHDGNFRSGDPVFPPAEFELTFDQNFLDEHPMPDNLYPYYCIVHVGVGMSGSVTVIAGGCTRDPEWQCDGDTDGDGQVNPVDSGLVQAAFGSSDEQDLCNYDMDCDGQINPVDSGIVQSLFGTCDPPRETCP